jgi:hypothetical protein
MSLIIPLLRHQINEIVAIMITGGNYEKNFYEGILIEVTDKYITLELLECDQNFEYTHFILATPLEQYH